MGANWFFAFVAAVVLVPWSAVAEGIDEYRDSDSANGICRPGYSPQPDGTCATADYLERRRRAESALPAIQVGAAAGASAGAVSSGVEAFVVPTIQARFEGPNVDSPAFASVEAGLSRSLTRDGGAIAVAPYALSAEAGSHFDLDSASPVFALGTEIGAFSGDIFAWLGYSFPSDDLTTRSTIAAKFSNPVTAGSYASTDWQKQDNVAGILYRFSKQFQPLPLEAAVGAEALLGRTTRVGQVTGEARYFFAPHAGRGHPRAYVGADVKLRYASRETDLGRFDALDGSLGLSAGAAF